ncbi:MAG: hypothetical protein KGZ25_05195 [Planctomycetes bacterium]|nr:hypothetical protein [Planctomycetota bacterium]
MQIKNPTEIGFKKHQQDKVTVYFDSAVVPESVLDKIVNLPELLQNLAGRDSRSAGHKSVWTWEPGWDRTSKLIVRKYVHGGLLRHLWGSWFLRKRQMLREINIVRHLQQHDVPTPSPVALRLQKVLGPICKAHYISEEVTDSVDILSACRAYMESTPPPPETRRSIASKIASLLYKMHEAGICHKDLNLKNILLSPTAKPVNAFIIDFKKAFWENEVSLQDKLKNLVRLDRSIVKWPASRQLITLSDRLRVMRDYIRLHEGPDSNWKDIARQVLTRHRLHSLSRK